MMFLTLLPGCFSTSVKPGLLQRKAGSDFGCPTDQVRVQQVTDNNWTAVGCEKHASYVCSGSNFMSDGSCMREGAVESSIPAVQTPAPAPKS
jgi:hypothetical protein